MKKIIILPIIVIFSLTSVQSFACGDHHHGKKKNIITEAKSKTNPKTS